MSVDQDAGGFLGVVGQGRGLGEPAGARFAVDGGKPEGLLVLYDDEFEGLSGIQVVADLGFGLAVFVQPDRGPISRARHDAQPDGVCLDERAVEAVAAPEVIEFLRRGGSAGAGGRSTLAVGLLAFGEGLLDRPAGDETGEAERDEGDAHEGQWD